MPDSSLLLGIRAFVHRIQLCKEFVIDTPCTRGVCGHTLADALTIIIRRDRLSAITATHASVAARQVAETQGLETSAVRKIPLGM
jgi:hypothetical protein